MSSYYDENGNQLTNQEVLDLGYTGNKSGKVISTTEENTYNSSEFTPDPSNAPVIIDLDGDGIEYLSLDNDITFTSEDSSDTYSTAWVGPSDGILGIDTDNSGSINLNKEYVFTEWSEDATTDMEALLEVFDTNNSGSLDPADLNGVILESGLTLIQMGLAILVNLFHSMI